MRRGDLGGWEEKVSWQNGNRGCTEQGKGEVRKDGEEKRWNEDQRGLNKGCRKGQGAEEKG